MTVSSTSNKITYAGDGSTTNFTFSFSIPPGASADIQVYFTDASGNITLLAPTTYTLTINTPISPNPTAVGGLVIYNPSSIPIPLGTQLTILRQLPETQLSSFVNQGALYPSTIEQAFDAATMLVQQLQELLGRQITVAVSDPTPATLPSAAQRANLAFMFDSIGNPIAAAPGGANSPVSSAMAPVVNAATIAAAVALLGLSGVAPEPSGVVKAYAGASAPTGYLLCSGQAVSRATFAALFAIIGTTYGVGDGSTTFNLPDLRGRVVPGLDNMGGITASRLTATSIPNGGGPTTLGGNGGAETVTLLVGQLPAHNHIATSVVTDPNHAHSLLLTGGGSTNAATASGVGGGSGSLTGASATGISVATTTNNTGSGNPTVVVQPSICLNYIIKT